MKSRVCSLFPSVSRLYAPLSQGTPLLPAQSQQRRNSTHSKESALKQLTQNRNEIYYLKKIWERAPLRNEYFKEQGPFNISRDPVEKDRRYFEHLGLRAAGLTYSAYAFNPVYAFLEVFEYAVTYFLEYFGLKWLDKEDVLPSTASDLIEGGQFVALKVIEACRKRNLRLLAPFCADPSILTELQQQINKLTEKQRLVFTATSDDFAGSCGGLILKANGLPTSPRVNPGRLIHRIYFTAKSAVGTKSDALMPVFTVRLCLIHKKNELLKKIKSFPSAQGTQRYLVPMPTGYGFRTTRYTVISLDFCSKASMKNNKLEFSQLQLYDFHINSF